MGQYEVTQELYEAVMGNNPSGFTAETITVGENQDYRPVDSVNWYQAVAFCNELTKNTLGEANCVYYSDSSYTTVYTVANANASKMPYFDQSKKGYRLPSEAEWECAARGGVYSSDENSVWNYDYPGTMSDIDSVAWYVDNAEEKTHEVGLKDQNSLYLYDMAGNLMEWCWDYYDEYSAGELTNNPTGINEGNDRVLRGGYYDDFDYCLSTSRYCDKPALTNISTLKAVGFRLCRYL